MSVSTTKKIFELENKCVQNKRIELTPLKLTIENTDFAIA